MAGTITALRFQKHNAERVNVYVDGQFVLALAAVQAAALHRGQHLTDEDVARLRALDIEEKAYERAVRYLGPRPRSVSEIRRFLAKHQMDTAVIDSVVERLQRAGYLDDQVFARLWVQERERFRPRGRVALRQELRQKGIAPDVIDETLQLVDNEAAALRAGRTQAQRLASADLRVFRQRLGGYLLRRGFDHEIVWSVVDQLWREIHDEETTDAAPDW